MVPSAGSMAVWPPFSLPIAHGLPTSSGSGVSELFFAFAKRVADRMNRREIDDVEPERGESRKTRRRVGEGAVTRRGARVGRDLRARKELVPRAEPRACTIDSDRQLAAESA